MSDTSSNTTQTSTTMYKQALPITYISVLVYVDSFCILLMFTLLIGIIRAIVNKKVQPLLYSTLMQSVITLLTITASAFAKREIAVSNSEDQVIFYDYPNIQLSPNTWLHYYNANIYTLLLGGIYTSGVLQILALQQLMSDKDTPLRQFIIEKPFYFFALSLLPGILFCAGFWLEVHVREMPIVSICGHWILPNIKSFFVISMYVYSLIITIYSCFLSRKSFHQLSKNQATMINAAKKSNVPNYVLFQTLEAGYALPILGLLKAMELLIWTFPSPLNVYYSAFIACLMSIAPIHAFLSNGANKTIYPYVPFVSGVLEHSYRKIVEKNKTKYLFQAVGASPISSSKSHRVNSIRETVGKERLREQSIQMDGSLKISSVKKSDRNVTENCVDPSIQNESSGGFQSTRITNR
ncbi:hypothetical protein HK103_003223 [Boothiomyces macroporosus]|uniref:Uncharacterized protein n=1 Tax=Boothiomyces macroporosus TaxID=261099 RepID=A0AAD5UI40_9FUNG|nr:hypothetical protein HK103_003223 [Boothiomyces macroporosus]